MNQAKPDSMVANQAQPSDGATPEPTKADDNCGFGIEGVPAGRSHKWEWVWEGPVWTDRQKCGNCGNVRQVKRFAGQ